MLCHCLSGSETAGNGSRTSLCQREHGIQDTLSRNQRAGSRKTLGSGPWHTDGPLLGHGQLLLRTVHQLNFYKHIIDRIRSVWNHVNDIALHVRRNHDLVYDRSCLRHLCNDGSRHQPFALFHCNMCIPFFGSIQRVHTDAPADGVTAVLCDLA